MMTKSGGTGLENHPGFYTRTFSFCGCFNISVFKRAVRNRPQMEKLFRRKGPGDPRRPDTDISLYPTRMALLEELEKQHQIVDKLVHDLEIQRFSEQVTWRFDHYMPTLGQLLQFMCITHESMHLGQLAAWRRKMDLPSALAKL